MVRRLLVFLATAGIITGAPGCALINPRPLQQNWKWDGKPRVMPNSI